MINRNKRGIKEIRDETKTKERNKRNKRRDMDG